MKKLLALFIVAFTVGFGAAALADSGSAEVLDAGLAITAPPADSHALPAPAAAAPDPLEHVAEDVGQVEKLWRSGAIPSAVIVGAFFVLLVLRQRVAWFADHNRAVYMSATIGGLTVLVDCIQRGQTPNASMVIVAIATAAALLGRMPGTKG